jgi:hypothetical protein
MPIPVTNLGAVRTYLPVTNITPMAPSNPGGGYSFLVRYE